jgi:hypothetical protein
MLSCDPDEIQAKCDNQPHTQKQKHAHQTAQTTKARIGTLKQYHYASNEIIIYL